jgi:exodeoxyribonuclease VII large subunit
MEKKTITVTALNKYLKYRFDSDENLKDIRLKAEISNFKRHSAGHLYFSLKDETSQVKAMMFYQSARFLKFEPKEGSKVIIEGYVSIYEATGNYQVYVNSMSEDGIGDLYQAFEQLKVKLSEAGLFDPAHKRPLPKFPKVVGVITSPTGAAVRDIINIINRRYPLVKIILYPALVQGDDAKFSVVKAIEKANKDRYADVLIVGRGGGSIEDLWAFNEEIVARAIYNSQIPVVSAVGHETDTTIADFVSDLRAPTPSGAAEIVVPDQISLLESIKLSEMKMSSLVNRILQVESRHLKQILSSYLFQNPRRLFEKPTMQVLHLNERLMQTRPDKLLQNATEKLNGFETRLSASFQEQLKSQGIRYQSLLEKLEILNPMNLMKKGYAILRKDGKIIRSVGELDLKDAIDISMADGVLNATINNIKKDV